MVAVTVAWGAFVAGLDAGMIYNTWPLMGGYLVPEDMWFLDPAALNFVENHAAVQFTHRWLAIATGSWCWRCGGAVPSRPSPRGHLVGHALGAMMVLQIRLASRPC